MNQDEVFSKVQMIFRDIFDSTTLTISREMNASHVEDWDSLAQINLIVAMEKEFRLKFSLIEMQAVENVGDMLDLIGKKTNAVR